MKKLLMPEKISLDKYFLPGITKKELRPLLLAAVPGVIVTVILWFALSQPLAKIVALLGGIGYAALCYMVFARLEGSQSIYTFITRIIRYNKSQHHYFYKHGKEVAHYVGEKAE